MTPAGLPPISSDYFRFFGLERRLHLDVEDLQRRFYALSRQLHPDRFGRKPAPEQQYALDATALLNDAWRTLKDPVTRAEYVLEQEGLHIAEQRSKDVPPELLEEVFELNMALEELREGDAAARPQLEQAQSRFLEMQHRIDAQLETLFPQYDEHQTPSVLQEIRGVLNRRRYIRNLVREVGQALSPAA